jgi:accessory gene regulator protein AgrB
MTFPSKLNLAPGGLDLIKVVLAHPKRKKKTIVKVIILFIVPLLISLPPSLLRNPK